MSLFNNSSRQLRRITEQSISMLKVSQNGNTIQLLSFLPSKSKTYHGRYEKYTTKTKHLTFFFVKCNTQLVVFILNELQIVQSFPRQKYFSFPTKNTFHKSTRKVKTQKNNNVFILE